MLNRTNQTYKTKATKQTYQTNFQMKYVVGFYMFEAREIEQKRQRMFFQTLCSVLDIVFCQTPGEVFRLGVDFVLPLSQQQQEHQEQHQQEQKEEPPPKSNRRGCIKSLKFECKGLEVKWTHVKEKVLL